MPTDTAVAEAPPAASPVDRTAPDPATNTAPGNTQRMNEPSEWDNLEAPPRVEDPHEFWDDLEDKEAEKGEETPEGETPAKTEDKPADTPAAGKEDAAAAKPEAEAAAKPEAAQAPAELTEKAKEFDFFDQVIRENPSGLAVTLLETLSDEERAKVFALYGQEAPSEPEQPDIDLDQYEPASDLEAALKSRWKAITSTPKQVQDIEKGVQDFQGKVAQAFKGLSDHVDATVAPQVAHANVQAEILNAKLDAVLQILDMDLPDPDVKAIQEALKDGRTTYKSAVRKVVDFSKQVQAAKQARRPRPETPGEGSRMTEAIPEGTGMVEIARMIRARGMQ